MTDLNTLKVSLTKNGFHKIWKLVSELELDELLTKTGGCVEGVNLNQAQVANILSAYGSAKIPSVWEKIKSENSDSLIQKLVFLSIIFSHHSLIYGLSKSSSGLNDGIGTITRGKQLEGKVYTNFAYTLSEFGLVSKQSKKYIQFDLSKILSDKLVRKYAPEIIELKLKAAGWDQSSSLIDECINNKLHKALSVNEVYFRDWLDNKSQSEVLEKHLEIEDKALDSQINVQFEFTGGHNEAVEEAIRTSSSSTRVVNLDHNRIQSLIFKQLEEQYGKGNVETEAPTKVGTFIDIVVANNGSFIFYELKTGNNIKRCIREAFSQLMEYSYWASDERASKLIIVSPNKITDSSKAYIERIRNKFNIPIYYQPFNNDTQTLSSIVD